MSSTPKTVAAPAAFGIDVIAVLLFVAIGRRSHDEAGSVISGVIAVAAPLLIGLVVGWLIAKAWKAPGTIQTGAIVWVTTVVVGMALRRLVFDRGIATAFIIVTTVVMCLFLLGWRLAAEQLAKRRAT